MVPTEGISSSTQRHVKSVRPTGGPNAQVIAYGVQFLAFEFTLRWWVVIELDLEGAFALVLRSMVKVYQYHPRRIVTVVYNNVSSINVVVLYAPLVYGEQNFHRSLAGRRCEE